MSKYEIRGGLHVKIRGGLRVVIVIKKTKNRPRGVEYGTEYGINRRDQFYNKTTP